MLLPGNSCCRNYDATAIDSFLSVVTAHIYCRNLWYYFHCSMHSNRNHFSGMLLHRFSEFRTSRHTHPLLHTFLKNLNHPFHAQIRSSCYVTSRRLLYDQIGLLCYLATYCLPYDQDRSLCGHYVLMRHTVWLMIRPD